MHFIFGYSREILLEIEQKTSIGKFVAIAVLIVLAFILLSFEDINEPIPLSDLTFYVPTCSAQMDVSDGLEIDLKAAMEQYTWTSELKNKQSQ